MIKDELKGQTLFLIGGGPSLKNFDLDPLKQNQDRVLTCNNAYALFPNAFLNHHADYCWYEWNHEQLNSIFKGKYKSTVGIGADRSQYPKDFRWLKKEKDSGFSGNFPFIRGCNAGFQLMNIAYILGATRVVLLGYDLNHGPSGETQWHKEHKRETNTKLWKTKMMPAFNAIAPHLEQHNFKVINANKNSNIRCFEFCDDYTTYI